MGNSTKNNLFKYYDRKDLTAINSEKNKISYFNLFNSSVQLAEYLKSKQIKNGNYTAVLVDNPQKFIECVIALWLIGAVPVPINLKLTNTEIELLTSDHDIQFLITDRNNNDLIVSSDTEIILINDLNLRDTSIDYLQIPQKEKEAVVIFTSGSTGNPKGVVHTFASLISSIESGNQILKQKENNSWLASLPFYHIGGFQIICRSLFYGCNIILPKSLQTDDLAEAIINFNPTHLSLVSPQLEKLIEKMIKPGKSLKASLIGGGFIEDELIIKAESLGWNPYKVYGSSETGSFVTAISANELKSKPASVGRSLPKVSIKISDQSEILLRSESIFKTYLNNEKETLIKIKENYYHSGDIGFVDEDGYLFIEARRNDLIVTGGENVNPIEVEKAISLIEGIQDVCVFAQQNKTWGQIVACVIVTKDKNTNEKEIKENLKQIIAGYKIPKKFYFAERLPKTSLGKLEREKIKQLFK